jgi:transcriptional regulator with XRE-family HTH domain
MKIELDVNQELGNLLKAMRLSAGMNQDEMSQKLGVTRSHISNLEKAKITNVLLAHLVRCGEATGFEVKLKITRKK